jgi:hypothetical protein
MWRINLIDQWDYQNYWLGLCFEGGTYKLISVQIDMGIGLLQSRLGIIVECALYSSELNWFSLNLANIWARKWL